MKYDYDSHHKANQIIWKLRLCGSIIPSCIKQELAQESTFHAENNFGPKAPSFEFLSTRFKDVVLIQRSDYQDVRGKFGKLYGEKMFNDLGMIIGPFKETVFSISGRNVIRGMHYQEEPYSCSKLISVVKGAIIDVVLNIKSDDNGDAKEFGLTYACHLSSENQRSLYIPHGYAHGFKSLEENTIVVYCQTNNYSTGHDKGIAYDSFGFDWDIDNPVVSEKDKNLPSIEQLKVKTRNVRNDLV